MKLLQNILTPVDFSPASEAAVEKSILLAKTFKSQISLLHVIGMQNIPDNLHDLLNESINIKINALQTKIKSEGISVKEVIIEKGVPFEKIIEIGQRNEFNVIIIGAGRNKDSNSFFLGTTAEKLIRKNQIPLWVVKQNAEDNINKIVCPVDFSDAAKRALSNAITLADKLNSQLDIINVYEPVSYYSVQLEVDNNAENKLLKENLEKDFNQFLEQFNFKSIKYTNHILEGEPHLEILKYIKRNNINLLVMGTTGKNELSRLLMGSVTEKVTREVPCSFITTKSKDITDDYFESNLKAIESILNVAKKLLTEQKYEQAVEKFTIALKQYPDSIPAVIGIIEAYKGLNNDKEAEHYKTYANDIIKRVWGEEYLEKFGF